MKNKTKLARALGVSRTTLYRDIENGCPTHSIAAAKRWRSNNVQPRHGFERGEPEPDFSGYSEEWLGALYYAMHVHMAPVVTGFMRNKGLTKLQALEGYRMLGFALMDALNNLFPGAWTRIPEPPTALVELRALGDEAWIAKYWPDRKRDAR